jgi:glycosyltransferase involved in cell wall biosynthesis
MKTLPLVTIGIANYNYADFVVQALNSAANQSYLNCELIIVDDCSTDNSIEVIEKWINDYSGRFKITFFKNTSNIGVAKVCKLILEKASGKYYQILDADDFIVLEKIESQVAILESDEKLALVYSNISVINEDNKIINDDYLKRIGYDEYNMPEGKIFNDLLIFNFIPNPSVLVRTQFARQTGGYNSNYQVQDYYLYLTLSEYFPFFYCNGISGFYRVHSNSLSNNLRSNAKSVEGSLKLQFENYSKGNDTAKANIRKSIFNMSPYFYRYDFPSVGFWLKKNFIMNPGIKSFGYFAAYNLGIPYTLFEKIKKKIFCRLLNNGSLHNTKDR